MFVISGLSATTLSWQWKSDDEDIKYYRYQLDGEGENNWTVVDGKTTSVILDSDSLITDFYLQASYDGVVWSDSSNVAYYPTNVEEKKSDIGDIEIIWTNDNDYNYFRYQRDGEEEDKWTVTDGKTESAVLPYHIGLNTYYIQSSWDGILWSESGICTYEYNPSSCTCDTLLWSWDIKDKDVKYVRYQLDGTSDDGWTEIEGKEKEVKLPAHEGTNTLFVESSYDKENWSETGYGTYISKPYRTNKYEVSLRAYPYELQRICYIEGHTPIERFSSYGGGGGVELRYNISSLFSLGINTSIEYYEFEAFHTYLDFKAVATAGLRIIGSSESRNKVYFTLGVGIDFVLRDDEELGCYPLISYGVRDSIILTKNTALSIGVDINHTFQNGTNVTHILPFLSFSYTWGCKAGCTNCEGGCR